MAKTDLLKKWTHKDAKQKIKKIRGYTMVLNYGTHRGGEILFLYKATKTELDAEKKLPHIYTVDTSKKLYLVTQANYMDWENAKGDFDELKNWNDVSALMDRT